MILHYSCKLLIIKYLFATSSVFAYLCTNTFNEITMLKSFNANYDSQETDEQSRLKIILEMMQALSEGTEMLCLLYSQYCEAARILREQNIKSRVDMPEEHAEAVLDCVCSTHQMLALLDCRKQEIEYQIGKSKEQ